MALCDEKCTFGSHGQRLLSGLFAIQQMSC